MDQCHRQRGMWRSEYTIPPSKAELAGEIDESNQLVVTITFEPIEARRARRLLPKPLANGGMVFLFAARKRTGSPPTPGNRMGYGSLAGYREKRVAS